MATNIVGIEDPTPEKIRIGMEVVVTFDKITEELSLPKFKLVKN